MPYSAILAHPEEIRLGKDGDPVYGDRAAKTWMAIEKLAASKGSERLVNFSSAVSGVTPWIGEITGEHAAGLLAQTDDAPVLMPAYIDLWSQTSPVPATDPEISLFLHGKDRSPASIQIVWRADVEEADLRAARGGYRMRELLGAIPPKSGEAIEVSLVAARRWLNTVGTDRVDNFDFSDALERSGEEDRTTHGALAFRWAGPDSDWSTVVRPGQLRPNDLIVVPADYGGCDEFGWDPASKQRVRDVASDAAQPFARRRFALRLTAKLLGDMATAVSDADDPSIAAQRERVSDFSASFLQLTEELRDGLTKAHALTVIAALREAQPPGPIEGALAGLAAWRTQRRPRPQLIMPYGDDQEGRPRGIVLLASKGIVLPNGGADGISDGGTPATEDDWLGSGSGEAQLLGEHSDDVCERARASASRVGLVQNVTDDLALSGFLHDTGKADFRFQTMLYGGNWFEVDDNKVLAKSGGRLRPDARESSGLPEHWRHEALSVRIAREHNRFCSAHDPELVLWLIGVHHGYGRPLFPNADEEPPKALPQILGGLQVASGPGPQSLAFEFNGLDWAQLFEHLKIRYGVWELARMEAILRLADHRASETTAELSRQGNVG